MDANTIHEISLDLIGADPEQPRKHFDPKEISALAASIRANGLLQPITVRPNPGDGPQFLVIAGERRFRAHIHNKAATVRAIVITPPSIADVRIKQIIENDQRVDVTPLEQARSYQSLMDETGWTAEELAKNLGKPVFRINERTGLLRLVPEYQALLASGNLKASEAQEMSRLDARGQAVLFKALKTGKAKNYNDLRAMANALVDAQPQLGMLDGENGKPAPTDEEHRHARTFEGNVEKIAELLRSGIKDNQITAVKKVNPHRAGHLADLFAAMQTDLRRLELALRAAAVQSELLELV